ncbi:MAG: LptF/LptG family permease [Verrucomicrobiota bacterium]|jgi:lipopolysaccharide export system permease protein|nr:LptF/LptG family permease [Verrucomicrobiota bacterium]
MKLIPHYLLRNLMRPWLYVLAGFSIIAVLIDLFDNFVNFMEAGTPFRQIFVYYAVLLPTYLPYILPVSLLLGLLYALWQLGKNSEITAMRASGLSLFQLIRPYLMIGLGCSLFLLALNELFNPWATLWTRQFSEMQQGSSELTSYFVSNVAYRNVVGNRIWVIDRFDPLPSSSYEMTGISLIQRRPDGSDEFRLVAARGRWVDQHWWFENVEMRYYLPSEQVDESPAPIPDMEMHHPLPSAQPDGLPIRIPSMEMTMISEEPRDFLNVIKDSTERSSLEIMEFIDKHRGLSEETQNRLLVDLHYRLASPWLCLIVILVGVPFGMHTGRRGMGLGILLALLTFFGYYVLMGLCLAWGKNQLIPPVLAGWAPLLIFFILGLVLLRRIR